MRYKSSRLPSVFEVLRDTVIIGNKIRLRDKRLSDARNDYAWQSDPELTMLDAAPLLNVSFPIYLLDYTNQIHDPKPNRYPFAIETFGGKHIGNCTCYDVSKTKGEAQLGILIGDRNYWDNGYGTDTVTTMVNHVFINTNLKRIYLKTLDWNLRAQKCFMKCGFMPCGQINRNENNFLVMELHREQWQKQQGKAEVNK